MKPNIILITVDCLRDDRIGARNTSSERQSLTPNIDMLVESGVRFTDASTGGCWTQAAFPVLLTSTYAGMYNGCLGPLSRFRPSLQNELSEHGYHTAAVQTSPLLGNAFGWNHGFDTFLELQPAWDAPQWHRWRGVQRLLRRREFQFAVSMLGLETRPAPVYALADEATDVAISCLEDLPEPYFLWIHYMDVHWPYYDDAWQRTPGQRARRWQGLQQMRTFTRAYGYQRPDSERLATWRTMYDATVTRVDEQIGRLVTRAEEMSSNPTCIVVTADHGEEMLERGRWGHGDGSLNQEILHVPLIMSGSAIHRPLQIDRPVSLLDVAPTLLDVAGFQCPQTMLGQSLRPLLTGQTNDRLRPPPIIAEGRWEAEAYRIAIRDDGFKYIIDRRRPGQYELYDLLTDPEERHDLSGLQPARALRFHKLLEKHLSLVNSSEEMVANAPQLSPHVEDRLRALGYVD